ncbi:MAG: hypothetical protein WBF90_33885 [Rivularia sp. (in: cyanobacteria)]
MVCKYWEAAKSSLSEFKVSMIRSIEMLQFMTIRQLKIVVSKLNKELGQVIVKSRFGKTYSQMIKAELVDTIWGIREIQMQAPKGIYEEIKILDKLFVQECGGIQWVHYFGFKTETEAIIFQRHINRNKQCKLSSLRRAKRLNKHGFEWEVKAWQVEESYINRIKKKYIGKVEAKVEAKVEERVKEKPLASIPVSKKQPTISDNFTGERVKIRQDAPFPVKPHHAGRLGTIVEDNELANYVSVSLDKTQLEKAEVIDVLRGDILSATDITDTDVVIAQLAWDNFIKVKVTNAMNGVNLAEQYKLSLEKRGFKVVDNVVTRK